MVGLAWMMLESCLPPIVPRIVSFWVTYAFLVFQLVSFHDDKVVLVMMSAVVTDCNTGRHVGKGSCVMSARHLP